ncbi:MAG: cyclase family protein, partial [Anaerolineae bacterium]|nr:cyclase family protein [Anaerolineae bacterium]
HMDGPAHFDTDGETIDNLPVSMFVGPAVVIDVSAQAAENPDVAVSADDLMTWEADNGEIPAGAVVFMNLAGNPDGRILLLSRIQGKTTCSTSPVLGWMRLSLCWLNVTSTESAWIH